MKNNLRSKKKKKSSLEGLTVTKDEAGHVIEKLYGVHIISQGDMEHHLGKSGTKSESNQKQKTESSGSIAKTESKQTKSADDSNDTE